MFKNMPMEIRDFWNGVRLHLSIAGLVEVFKLHPELREDVAKLIASKDAVVKVLVCENCHTQKVVGYATGTYIPDAICPDCGYDLSRPENQRDNRVFVLP